jgi:hypothetical protein
LRQVSLHKNVDCVHPSLDKTPEADSSDYRSGCQLSNGIYAPWNYYLTADLNSLRVTAVLTKNAIARDKYANRTYAMLDEASNCH